MMIYEDGRRPGLCLYLIGIIALIVIVGAGCSHTAGKSDRFDLYVKDEADLKKRDQLQAMLTVTPEKAALHPDFQIIENIAVPYLPEYRIGAGDVVEIVYHIRYEKTAEEYRLEVQDKISITFPYHPQFSTTVLVRTDGKITVPLLGDVAAESKTPEELAAVLNKGYSKYLNHPSLTVALEQFNVKIDELKKAITTAPRGQSKIAPVTPDGRIAFPIIGSIQAQGLTAPELEKVVNDRYSKYIRNLNATLILLEIHHAKFYIVGEVERPGAYEMISRVNLLDALSLAGGFKKSAFLQEVVIFRNDGLERPVAMKVDLQSVLESGFAYNNLDLKPADIVYLPKTRIDRFDDLVEKIFTKGLYAIFPFQTVFSINYDLKYPSVR
jgi:polysaccharide biosynthesis/export protein